MARPSYLGRRPDGRYCIQIRLGKRADAIYGRPLLRVSLRTADFLEARRRLVDNLGWVVEVVQAADLEALGDILHHRLGVYVDGAPGNERRLAERLAFEQQVRNYIARAQERGYLFARHFPDFASRWVDFVDQNKFAEAEIVKNAGRRSYEAGRADERAATTQAQSHNQPAMLSSSPLLAPLDPVALIERIVQDEVARRLASGPAPRAEPEHLALPPAGGDAGGETAARSGDKRMSVAAADFLKPADRKRQRRTKGRSDAEPVVRFAVEFFGDPVFNNLMPDDWTRLDEALTEIPKTKGIPRDRMAFAKLSP